MRMMQTRGCTRDWAHKRLDDANDADPTQLKQQRTKRVHRRLVDVNVAQLTKRAPKRLDETQPAREQEGAQEAG